MQPVEQELSETYRGLSDSEVAALFAERDTLTDVARDALTVEIGRRGIGESRLLKLHSSELQREEHFDRREKIHRQKVLHYLFRGDDPKWVVAAILALIGVALLSELISHHS